MAFAIALLGACAAEAGTVHVAVGGVSGAKGTRADPVPDLAEAAALARPGDTVLVEPGTYRGPQLFNRDGAPGASIRIRPAVAGSVIFDGRGSPADSDLVTLAGDYLSFSGFSLVNAARSGISLWQTTGSEVSGNQVTGSRRAGIWVGGDRPGRSSRNRIAGNAIRDNCRENVARTLSSGWSRAIAIDLSDRSTVERNLVERNFCEGIGVLSARRVTVRQNVVSDNFSADIYLDNAPESSVVGNIVFSTGDRTFFRHGVAATGVLIANEVTRVMLPSEDIVVQQNLLIGVGPVGYADFGAGGGLHRSALAPNDAHPFASIDVLLPRIQEFWPMSPREALRYCGRVIRC